ncbi:N-acetylmuramoyl-L-alanine amidase [Oscillospiraceae bacterium OttesenSCG-928-G22]|nr:N-acetylmuramoyl-L-alanine amidase [Oscillospiraceae bacterium OttesenSCG-928-G22]
MTIQKPFPALKWNGPLSPLDLSRVDAIALHHMAHPTASIHDVHGWHLAQDWVGIGYNYFVGLDGIVYEGRGLHRGAGVKDQNHHIISVGFQGDFQTKQVGMNDAQFAAGVAVIRWLRETIPGIKTVGGHKDFGATACPGRYFPLERMIEEANRVEQEKRYQSVADLPDWAKETVQKLIGRGALQGDGKGLNLSVDMVRMMVINDRMGVYGE